MTYPPSHKLRHVHPIHVLSRFLQQARSSGSRAWSRPRSAPNFGSSSSRWCVHPHPANRPSRVEKRCTYLSDAEHPDASVLQGVMQGLSDALVFPLIVRVSNHVSNATHHAFTLACTLTACGHPGGTALSVVPPQPRTRRRHRRRRLVHRSVLLVVRVSSHRARYTTLT